MQNDMNQVPQGTPVSPNPNYVMPPQPVNTTITVEKKKGNGPKIIIIILAIVVVAVAAYLVYDKVIKKDDKKDDKESGEVVENEETPEETPEQPEKDIETPEEGTVLSDAEALKIGKELFEYTRTFAFFGSDLVKYATPDGKYPDDDPVDLGEDYGEGFEITNYDEIMSHFAKGCKRVEWDYENPKAQEKEFTCDGAPGLATKNGKHYAIEMYRGSNTSFTNMSDLKIKEKTASKIEFTVDFSFCLDDDTIRNESGKCIVTNTEKVVEPTTYTKTFIIVKEDGSWKIQKYYSDNM